MIGENPFLYLVLAAASLLIVVYIRMLIHLQRHGMQFQMFKFRLILPYLTEYRKLSAVDYKGEINLSIAGWWQSMPH